MAEHKTTVTSLLKYWNYCSLALNILRQKQPSVVWDSIHQGSVSMVRSVLKSIENCLCFDYYSDDISRFEFVQARQFSCHSTCKIVMLFGYYFSPNSKVCSYILWRHQMEIFSVLLAICAGNSPVPGEFPAQRPVTRSFDVFSDLHLNKRLSTQWRGWWLETLSHQQWRHRNENLEYGRMHPFWNGFYGFIVNIIDNLSRGRCK